MKNERKVLDRRISQMDFSTHSRPGARRYELLPLKELSRLGHSLRDLTYKRSHTDILG